MPKFKATWSDSVSSANGWNYAKGESCEIDDESSVASEGTKAREIKQLAAAGFCVLEPISEKAATKEQSPASETASRTPTRETATRKAAR